MGTFDAQAFFESIPVDEVGGFAFFAALLGDATANENGWRDYKDGRWYKNGPPHTVDEIKESNRKVKRYYLSFPKLAQRFGNGGGWRNSVSMADRRGGTVMKLPRTLGRQSLARPNIPKSLR
jgi:hypothetical protein